VGPAPPAAPPAPARLTPRATRRALIAAALAPAAAPAPAGPALGTQVVQIQDPVHLRALESADVPQATCPGRSPYLVDQGHVPFGTSVPKGVELVRTPGVGVFIEGPTSADSRWGFATGTRSTMGWATNWTLQPQALRVVLHCSDDTPGRLEGGGRLRAGHAGVRPGAGPRPGGAGSAGARRLIAAPVAGARPARIARIP
jgi:hypothetical protein